MLFGSAGDDIETAEDYDIAIIGYPDGKFYEIVSRLEAILDKSCDIIDYDLHKVDLHPLSKIIDRDGELLYEN